MPLETRFLSDYVSSTGDPAYNYLSAAGWNDLIEYADPFILCIDTEVHIAAGIGTLEEPSLQTVTFPERVTVVGLQQGNFVLRNDGQSTENDGEVTIEGPFIAPSF